MATSQNGFPALTTSSSALHRWVIPGCDREFTLRYGSAGFILMHHALWFHESVEKLDTGIYDDWGYAYRDVRFSNDLSNHASGTAYDGNATKHPLGKYHTFTLANRVKIRARLPLYAGCIRWGGNYTGRPDDMHFEINRNLSSCETVAKRLLNTPRGKRLLEANPGQKKIIYS